MRWTARWMSGILWLLVAAAAVPLVLLAQVAAVALVECGPMSEVRHFNFQLRSMA